ncbi:MAG: glycosyltransferase [Clostridia bacterium]|nr:glycosyltransferase [Clostridia bacterium]
MKKILFTAYTLEVGGIETALASLLNNLVDNYDITLVLEKKQGLFLDEINKKIKIIEYNPNQNKNPLIRKTINLFKRINFIIKYKNKFDFAASFATYSKMGSFCARIASKNNALWGHLNYIKLFKNKKDMMNFFRFVNYDKFSYIVFVSDEGANTFKEVFPNMKNKVLTCNNLIDYEKIINMSNEKIDIRKEEKPTFLNVGRHEEKQKRLTRIIEASKLLVEEGFDFRVLMVGDGPDTEKYKKLVKENNLNNYFVFCGRTKNPYPYFKISDATILTSEYEGYPVVFVESLVLGVPILTTDVSDAKKEIHNKHGLVTKDNTHEEIAVCMKEIILNNNKYKNEFNAKKFNEEILKKMDIIINGG